MPDLNDFYAFNSTSGSNDELGGCFPWKTILIIAIICQILTLFSECSGWKGALEC